jgi:hypothetical protein
MPSPQVLEVHFPNEEASTEWRRSSQAVSNLYMNGTKFWTKSDLRDIEQQLSESKTLEHFTLHTVDGRTIIIKNRVFGEEASIW